MKQRCQFDSGNRRNVLPMLALTSRLLVHLRGQSQRRGTGNNRIATLFLALSSVLTLSGSPGLAQEPRSESATEGASLEEEKSPPAPPLRRRIIDRPVGRHGLLVPVTAIKYPFNRMGAVLEKGLEKVERGHALDRVQEARESLTSKGYEPLFGGLGPGAGLSFGVNIFRERFLGTPVRLDVPVQYSTNGYTGLGARLTFPIKGERLFLATEFDYEDRPQEDFFGVGSDSSEVDRSNFALEKRTVRVTLGSQLRKGLRAGIRAGLTNASVGRGTDNRFPGLQDRFDVATLPGAAGAELLSVGSYLERDYRNNPTDPTAGGIWRVEAEYFRDTDARDFRFMRYLVHATHYVPLSDEHVVAIRGLGIFNEAQGSSAVPFFMKAVLGGRHTLRGFREFRFYDDAALLFSAECRWQVWRFADAVVFVDEGQVAPGAKELGISRFRNSHGMGLRFKGRGGQLFRVDVGHSNEGWRLYFSFSPDF